MEISVVSPSFPEAAILTVACRTGTARRAATGRRYNTQERATKICLVGAPTGVSGRPRAVARWDGNVALQRWGCGRCRPRDGGRGYRFTARRSPILRLSGLLLAESVCAVSLSLY